MKNLKLDTASGRIKKLAGNVYFIYTLLFFLIGFVSLFWIIVADKSMFKNVDSFCQWYPFMVYLRRTVREVVVNGHFNFWAWNVGVGNDNIITTSIVFMDPFNYIAAAFPVDKIDVGYAVAEFVRLYTAGLIMLYFLRYQKASRAISVIGAVSYVFCSWSLRATAHASFLTQMVVFPLIILGIERFEREKKSKLLIAAVFFSLITYIYFSYMSCILVVIYLVLRFIMNEGWSKDNISKFMRYLGKYMSRVAISVLLAGFVFVPTLIGIMQTGKGESYDLQFLPKLKDALSYLPGYISNYEIFGNYSAVCLGAFFFAMIPAMFISVKDKRFRLPILMFFICAVFLFFPIFNSIFNALHYPIGRWCYGMMFFYTWAGIVAYENIQSSDAKAIRKYMLGAVILYGIVLINISFTGVLSNILQRGAFYISTINIAFAVAFGILMFTPDKIVKRRIRKAGTVALVAVDLALCIFIYYSPNVTSQLSSHHDLDLAYTQYQKSLLVDFDTTIDDDFYRVDYKESVTYNPKLDTSEIFSSFGNESMYADVPSVFSFSSLMNYKIFDFDDAIGVNNIYRTMNNRFDGRSRLDFLLGIQYFVARDQRNIDNAAYGFEPLSIYEDTTTMQNRYDVGLGYVFSYVIPQSVFESYSLLDREQILMQAAVVPDNYSGKVPFISEDDLVLDTVQVPYEITEYSGLEIRDNTLIVTENKASITIEFDKVHNSELYISFTDVARHANTLSDLSASSLNDDSSAYDRMMFDLKNIGYEDDSTFRIDVNCGGTHVSFVNKTGLSNQAIPRDDYLGHMGYYETSPGKMTIRFDKPGTYDLGSFDLYAVSQEHFDEQASTLVNNRFITEDLGTDSIKGSVDSDGGILYFSIVNNGGWSAYVDGKKVDIINNVDVAFMGIEVEPGYHTIELKYECPGFKIGVVMSIAGILALAGVWILERNKMNSTNQTDS